MEERAAGDGSGSDSVYIPSIFGHDERACRFATDDVLSGFVGILEPLDDMITESRSLLVFEDLIVDDTSFGIKTDHDLLRSSESVCFTLHSRSRGFAVEGSAIDGESVDLFGFGYLHALRQHGEDGLLLLIGLLCIDGIECEDVHTGQQSGSHDSDDDEAEDHILE